MKQPIVLVPVASAAELFDLLATPDAERLAFAISEEPDNLDETVSSSGGREDGRPRSSD